MPALRPRTAPPLRRQAHPATPGMRAWFTARSAMAAREELTPLLRSAADLDLDDADEVAALREHAHRVTSRLSASGALPAGLVVARDEPGVVLGRSLAAAWRGVTPPPGSMPGAGWGL